jgi:tetratricopeptide (TPR) repeat protein
MMLLTGVAAAADDDPQARARAHYEIGSGLYRLGDYSGAQREFAAGYELTHKPGFLLNLGQTYRKLHDLSSARDMYKKFLDDAPPEDPQRAQARQVLGDIEAELRSQPAPAPSPVPKPAVVSAPVVAPVAPAPSAVVAAPRPPKKRGRALQIAGITVGIVGLGLAGGGLGAAVLADDAARDLNTLDRNGGVFDSAKDDRYHLDRALEGALLGVGCALVVTGVVLVAAGSR